MGGRAGEGMRALKPSTTSIKDMLADTRFALAALPFLKVGEIKNGNLPEQDASLRHFHFAFSSFTFSLQSASHLYILSAFTVRTGDCSCSGGFWGHIKSRSWA